MLCFLAGFALGIVLGLIWPSAAIVRRIRSHGMSGFARAD